MNWHYKKDNIWIKLEDDISLILDSEYNLWKFRNKFSSLHYYCFGDGLKTGVNFFKMHTFCTCESNKCTDHNVFLLKKPLNINELNEMLLEENKALKTDYNKVANAYNKLADNYEN